MNPATDPQAHKRYLDYRERHVYFARQDKEALLSMAEFDLFDTEFFALEAKGEARDDEEEARFEEVARRLFRD